MTRSSLRTIYSPANLTDLVQLVASDEGARLIAGNTEVGVEAMVRQVRPAVYISSIHVPELRQLRHDQGELWEGKVVGDNILGFKSVFFFGGFLFVANNKFVIGAGVTLQDLQSFMLPLSQRQGAEVGQGARVVITPSSPFQFPFYQASLPQAVVDALYLFAGPQIRAVATVGGNLANASPISDLNPIWLATNTVIEVASVAGW